MKCSVPFCSDTSSDASLAQGGLGVTFHEFPKEARLRAAWLRALGKQDCQLPDSSVVCSQHFLHDDIYETEGGAKQLRADAVPSAVLVCMTCLNTDSKMFQVSQHSLRVAYERLTGYPLCDGGNLKLTFCAQCVQWLRDFTRFREQSLRVRSLMMELLEKHELITQQHIRMIQHENDHLKNNLVSTMLGPDPDPFDMCIGDNTDEDRQTGSEETALGVAVKTECSDDTQSVDESTHAINEENSYADCVSEEFDEDLIKYESAVFMCTVCYEQFHNEHAYTAHAHLHDYPPDNQAPKTDHRTNIDLKSCVVKLYDILRYPESAKIEVESSPETLRAESFHDNAHTACVDAQYRAVSADEVTATHNEPDASVLSATEPGTSGHSSRTRTFTCNECERAFIQKDHLVSHMNSHSGEKHYARKICSYQFTCNSNLLTHMRNHTGEEPYSCKLCSYKSIQKHNLVRHMKTHTGEKPYSCKLCSYKCTQKHKLVCHMRTHTGEKPYSCKLCSYKSIQKHNLVRHMKTHTGEKPYSCKLCCYKSTEKSNLHTHMRIHTGEKPYSCKLCSYKSIQKHNLVRHMKTHTGEKPYSCKLCCYKSTEKSNLHTHMRIHTGEKPYSCKLCSYKSIQKHKLVCHMRTHTGEKPYSCKLCCYKSTEKSKLHRHMRIHTGEKPYSCKLCSYKSIEKSNLHTHMRIHTGEKPYSCKLCSYKSIQKHNLVCHMRTHTGEKPYSCNLCSYKCTQKHKLVCHMRTHTGEKPYSCKLCSYKSTEKSKLHRHMRIHTGEKPYSCKLCSYKYIQKGSLVSHMRAHTSEKPYSCNLCTCKYSKKGNLVYHMKIHTDE